MSTPTATAPWHPPNELPDYDRTVLLRLDSTNWPVCTGFHDGEFWRHAEADKVRLPIKGWMSLTEAARFLDAAKP